jgi:predicted dehydrogenase
MKYGIIGTGWIAESFIAGVRLKTDSEIVAVYSRTAEKGGEFAQRNSIPAIYTNLDIFLESDMDAVYIASPNVMHYPQSKKCLEAGKHVICEKPVTVTPEQYEECKRIADKNGLIYIEAIMYMHTPAREVLRENLKRIGRITSAHFDFSQLSSKYPAYLRGENPNIFNPQMATGSLMDLGIYCVYPALDLFGIPEKITADVVFLDSGADASGSVSFNYGDKLITFTHSKTGQDYSGSEIFGDEGTIHIESISKLINVFLYKSDAEKEQIIPEYSKPELMGFEAENFENFIKNPANEKYLLSSKNALQVCRLMQEIRDRANIRFKEYNYD